MKKISVIIPIYNREKYLSECLTSVINQSYSNLEIILVDDGSTDQSLEIIQRFSKQDDRIKYYTQNNQGVASARNSGLKMVTGDFITFVDSDDWVVNNMYEKLMGIQVESDADIVVCNMTSKIEKLNGYNSTNYMTYGKIKAVKSLYTESRFNFCLMNKLFKKHIFNHIKFPENRDYEDAAVMYKLLLNADTIVHFDTFLYFYRTENESITRSGFSSKRIDVLINYDETIEYLKKIAPELIPIINVDFYYTLRNLMIDYLNSDYEKQETLQKIQKYMKKLYRNSGFDKLSSKEKVFGWSIILFPKASKSAYFLRKKVG
ncbi:hypothetical protein JMA_33820 [Jeotgalibacillus malaysiensis]|uniref:Glycosyltransferase 2-like domain-containing protein n=1 Tax=Jeotgalibacillus malaysiensis TaxID=1508404 RepID=A0A0B5AXF2_9BACL|nr:glycosyltransferase family 2 protein [Jeotgalibacillus malaysiensis]AJD92699.1 hypothetical protein JMA_33820 [Jeotgalibacillus malaysiensis]